MSSGRWELFPHEADMGVRGVGSSKEEAFEQAAVALTAVITEPQRVTARETVEMSCDAADDELLLVTWLNACIYEMATRRMLFSSFEVRINGTMLCAKAWGETIDAEKHQPAVEVKGATCTSLLVRQDDQGIWVAQCVVDV